MNDELTKGLNAIEIAYAEKVRDKTREKMREEIRNIFEAEVENLPAFRTLVTDMYSENVTVKASLIRRLLNLK